MWWREREEDAQGDWGEEYRKRCPQGAHVVERERERRMPREAGKRNIESDAHKEPMWWRKRQEDTQGGWGEEYRKRCPQGAHVVEREREEDAQGSWGEEYRKRCLEGARVEERERERGGYPDNDSTDQQWWRPWKWSQHNFTSWQHLWQWFVKWRKLWCDEVNHFAKPA